MNNIKVLPLIIFTVLFSSLASRIDAQIILSNKPIEFSQIATAESMTSFTDADKIYALAIVDKEHYEFALYPYCQIKSTRTQLTSYPRAIVKGDKCYILMDIIPDPAIATTPDSEEWAKVLSGLAPNKATSISLEINRSGEALVSAKFTFTNTGAVDLLANAELAKVSVETFNTAAMSADEDQDALTKVLDEKYKRNSGDFADPELSRDKLKEFFTRDHNGCLECELISMTVDKIRPADFTAVSDNQTGLPKT